MNLTEECVWLSRFSVKVIKEKLSYQKPGREWDLIQTELSKEREGGRPLFGRGFKKSGRLKAFIECIRGI